MPAHQRVVQGDSQCADRGSALSSLPPAITRNLPAILAYIPIAIPRIRSEYSGTNCIWLGRSSNGRRNTAFEPGQSLDDNTVPSKLPRASVRRPITPELPVCPTPGISPVYGACTTLTCVCSSTLQRHPRSSHPKGSPQPAYGADQPIAQFGPFPKTASASTHIQ